MRSPPSGTRSGPGRPDHVPGRLPGRDDGQLLLGGGAGEHPSRAVGGDAPGGAAVDHFLDGADDAEVPGDGSGGGGVVAGDQHRGDARRLAGCDGGRRGRAGRVEDRGQPQQPQPVFHGRGIRQVRPVRFRHCQHTEAALRQILGPADGPD